MQRNMTQQNPENDDIDYSSWLFPIGNIAA